MENMICQIHGNVMSNVRNPGTGRLVCPNCGKLDVMRNSDEIIKPKHVLFDGKLSNGAAETLAAMWIKFLEMDLDKAIMDLSGVVVTMEKKQTSSPLKK